MAPRTDVLLLAKVTGFGGQGPCYVTSVSPRTSHTEDAKQHMELKVSPMYSLRKTIKGKISFRKISSPNAYTPKSLPCELVSFRD